MGVLDGAGNLPREGAILEVNLRASHCNQHDFVTSLFSAVRGGDAVLPKFLRDFLLLPSVKPNLILIHAG